jgi:membrane protease YdiL (CAAX protease family)
MASNGLFLAVSTCASAPVGVALTGLFASMRRGITVRDYLGLRPVSPKRLLGWCAALLGLIAASDGLSLALGKPVVPEFMDRAYASAGFAPLLWLALVVAAPVSEELLFRGFCMTGIRASRLGNWGAVVVSSLIWSAMHLQYDAYGIASIFVSGLLLGWARLRTDSTVTPMVMHALMNLVATVEVVVKIQLSAGG